MKKIIALVLSLVLLCSASAVFADATPSKTTADLVAAEVAVENPVEGKTPALEAATEQADLDAAAAELAKLTEQGVDAYFGAEAVAAVAAILGEGAEVSVDEFLPIKVVDYEEGMGDATITLEFPTAYAAGEKVAILVGLPEGDAIVWNVYEGVGLENGQVQFTLPADVMLAIVNGTALVAVVSK